MQDPTVEAVREANQRFYRAFESLEIAPMEDAWARGEEIKCVHPGWAMIKGWDNVMESWRRIFDNASMMRFTVTDVDIRVEGDWAWVSCAEVLMSVNDGKVVEARVQATNVFMRQGDRWLLLHHHASPVV